MELYGLTKAILRSTVLWPAYSRRNAVLDRISNRSNFIRSHESRMVRRWNPPQVCSQIPSWSGIDRDWGFKGVVLTPFPVQNCNIYMVIGATSVFDSQIWHVNEALKWWTLKS